MKTPFFASEMKRARLVAIAERWKGTPFVKGGKLCGAGVDCIHLAAEIYRECGVFEAYQFPRRYSLDGGAHLQRSMILEWIALSPHFQKVYECPQVGKLNLRPPLLTGDLMCLKNKKVAHHVGVVIENHFVHILGGGIVELEPLRASYRFLTHVFRPIDLGGVA